MIEFDVEQEYIKQLVSKTFPIKVVQSIILTVNTCEQEMIEFVEDNKRINNQDK